MSTARTSLAYINLLSNSSNKLRDVNASLAYFPAGTVSTSPIAICDVSFKSSIEFTVPSVGRIKTSLFLR